jgi:L,D-transpeptidase catalytic domain
MACLRQIPDTPCRRLDHSEGMKLLSSAALAALALTLAGPFVPSPAAAQAVNRGKRPILDVARSLKNGQYVWAPELAGEGPALVVVNLETQKLVMFRRGVPMAASTVSSGAPGHRTPTGVFSILQKKKEHYSNLYKNAPMPNMQRLTWQGIALHAGNLPGYPASHGCVRLPHAFSKLLFGATKLGMTVVITSIPALPRDSAAPGLMQAAAAAPRQPLANAAYQWNPKASPAASPLAVVISTADRRAIVMRGGKQIGSAPVRVSGPVDGATAYVLKSRDKAGRHWLKLQFSGPGGSMEVASEEAKRFDSPAGFRAAVAAAAKPGSVVIVTPDSLKQGSPGKQQMVLEDEKAGK